MTTKSPNKPALQPDLIDEVTQHCLLTRTRSISRVVTSIYDQALRSYDVNSSQFSMLVLIAKMNGGSRAEIGRANHLERSTSTRNLQLLLDQGWIEELESTYGRSRPIVLSDAGRRLLVTAMPAWRAAQQTAKRLLGKEGAAALLSIANRLLAD
ncbi:MarR family transcriptional regulator [Paraburkholderia ginsengiterrae]|uniref:MarR family transcriptional regulator n=1 Tax=Paraburkholderia ginsengiterrae TaxID=1462993 RepID=A0A1A9N454_9BURK|nr:MarR family winged helix-turn-helix transcriptional regulator [Paraburkholderia ginsengiterrae]OAJ53268.1 MarR family transcriptional regulator [Paraburkholderia ginsengiterrae]OAJ55904.1 MarR family transcriptional regulator [Paraburkholderia ginsengiterrae]